MYRFMQWQDHGIILRRKMLGERAWIVTILTHEHGLHKGVLKDERSHSHRWLPSTGDRVVALWTARLADQLGTWRLDLETAMTPVVLRDAARLRGLMVFGELLSHILTERTPCPDLFIAAQEFLEHLNRLPGKTWGAPYLFFELFVLKQVGFGLDFRDAVLATDQDPLTYVSPRTGRVVTRSKGEPYRHQLLRLPEVLRTNQSTWGPISPSDFHLTAFFLQKILSPENYSSFYCTRNAMIQSYGLD